MKPKKILKILKDNGFEKIRQSGSHVILKGETKDEHNIIIRRENLYDVIRDALGQYIHNDMLQSAKVALSGK